MANPMPAASDAQPPSRSIYVPPAVFDCAAHIVATTAAMTALEAERETAAAAYLRAMRELRTDGSLTDLIAATEGFRSVYGKGWTTRLKEAGLPQLKTLVAEVRGMCNDGEGRWRGPFPLSTEDVRPAVGTWVVYQLTLGSDLLYIGSTGSLYDRLKAHSREKTFDSWRAARCATEIECRHLETALIDRYRPPLNRMIPAPKVVLV